MLPSKLNVVFIEGSSPRLSPLWCPRFIFLCPGWYSSSEDRSRSESWKEYGAPGLLKLIGADMRYLLHGNENYDYHGPCFAGDTVQVVNRVKGFSDAKGGALEIAHLEMEISHPERGLLAVARRDLIHRLPKEKQA